MRVRYEIPLPANAVAVNATLYYQSIPPYYLRQRADRGPEWTTIEEEKAIARGDLAGRVVVVDCATLWLTNFFLDAKSDAGAAHARTS